MKCLVSAVYLITVNNNKGPLSSSLEIMEITSDLTCYRHSTSDLGLWKVAAKQSKIVNKSYFVSCSNFLVEEGRYQQQGFFKFN